MTILEDGAWLGVSTVIGVCGENFCSLLGDTRRTVNTSGDLYSFHDDNTQKVFKINYFLSIKKRKRPPLAAACCFNNICILYR